MVSPRPRDIQLYNKIKNNIYKKYPKHSAYRSGLLVQKYKKVYTEKYPGRSPYIGQKPKQTGLTRWYKEDWRNQRGEVGYKYKSDVYRPTKRVTRRTPITFSELTQSEINRARRTKNRSKRVSRFGK